MMDERDRDDDFVARISGKLRAGVRGDASFTERVMSAVREEATQARAGHERLWLLRPRSVRFTPLGALALAATLAVAAVGVDRMVRSVRPSPDGRTAAAAPDTVHVIRFVLADSAARSVMLVGSFNGWNSASTPMQAFGDQGVWTVSLALPAGRHEYAFLVRDARGQRWVADPAALQLRDEFGVPSSIVVLGGRT
ncbi:MAG TPA: isoamylase early set domain-containing protein [Gemmatimonadaceae bacterium]|nr:isoamylase early set domain-containing protein [Gemmatimonadaceae bacterium]